MVATFADKRTPRKHYKASRHDRHQATASYSQISAYDTAGASQGFIVGRNNATAVLGGFGVLATNPAGAGAHLEYPGKTGCNRASRAMSRDGTRMAVRGNRMKPSPLYGWVLPRGGTIVLMYCGYFDESGDLNHVGRIFCIAGYVLASDNAEKMDGEWRRVLGEHDIPYFHMVDCAPTPPNGVFIGKSDEERAAIVTKLIGLIRKYTAEGFSILVDGRAFDDSPDVPDTYTHCAEWGAELLQILLHIRRARGREQIAYFFESGHKSKNRAYQRLAEMLVGDSVSLTFAGKQEVPLLQAADLLAWQSHKYLADQVTNARRPRKDFLSLMEHPHTFIHLRNVEGRKNARLEIWPESRRTKHPLVKLQPDESGPILIFREERDPTPIIYVYEQAGWRVGSGGLSYVRFTDLKEQYFTLAFPELALHQAIVNILGSTAVFPGKQIIMATAKRAQIVRNQDTNELILRIVMNGWDFGYRLSKRDLEGLRDAISEAIERDGDQAQER